ncbi:Zinc finger BED domain-containing protein DAYSLEEPER [Nymphaea thermarum]|nr:Zinc finger BED domain-containing protein DAYSLEEPER [Nymphaea thermarum]
MESFDVKSEVLLSEWTKLKSQVEDNSLEIRLVKLKQTWIRKERDRVQSCEPVTLSRVAAPFAVRPSSRADCYALHPFLIAFGRGAEPEPSAIVQLVKFLLGNLDKPDAVVKYETIESTLHEMYAEYSAMYEDSDTCNMEMANASTSTMIAREEYKSKSMQRFKAYVNSVSPVVVHTDLDNYLIDPLEEYTTTAEFNILSWWKTNESKYKILAKMARDVPAIPGCIRDS